jgi:AbrB family looped-hinge helix DNA binding protein
MSEATMTSKGQITVPKDIRLKLGLRPGDRIRFLLEADGRVRLMPAKRDISELVGILPKPKRALSIEEMDDAIGRAVAEKFARQDRD